MRRLFLFGTLAAIAFGPASPVSAQPVFVNGIKIAGNAPDATRQTGANQGRFGFFSDIYYEPNRNEWWALSDRGPGGGLLDYSTRLSRFKVNVHPVTGEISQFRVLETILFTDPDHLLAGAGPNLNGLNPLSLNGDASVLGHSFDPEGLVVDPWTSHFYVADEYGPALYEFDRKGRLKRIFDVPQNLVPMVGTAVNYVATRDDGANAGRQDNRGYEGVAISPDGRTLYAVLQDPLINDPTGNNGRNSRNVRIVVYDNDRRSPTYGSSIKQLAYRLEAQAAVAARINAIFPGNANGTNPRQGRNIGVSSIVAINKTQFLVLERDNRGIGVDDPAGANGVGSKRVFKIDITNATDVSGVVLPADALPPGVIPVAKDDADVFIDLSASTLLPNGKQAEKWEGLAIGPRLLNGARLILAGNDNDYSVTQTGAGEQFDVYVDFNGNVAKCVLDDSTKCEVNPPANDTVIDNPVALPAGYQLLPGVLHAYRVSKSDLEGYIPPGLGWLLSVILSLIF
jgi:hypothetical protein